MSYLDGEWYAEHNKATDPPCWQARTVAGDDLIASAYTEEHIARIVLEHNAYNRLRPRPVQASRIK